MANSVPVGHYSQLGEQTIRRITTDDAEYMRFLKFFGRVFKHPVSVALEFYVNRPDAQFIASGAQWKKAGFQVNPASKGIQFLDEKGDEITLYDFDDVIGDYPPKRWTITNKNVDVISERLELPKNEPIFSALDSTSASAIDDLSLIQELELNDLSNEEMVRFRNSYHNMIQLMIAGRLEINGARYNVQPDRTALEFCKSDEQKLILLTTAASSARKALLSVEYAFNTIRTEIQIRKEAEKNDLRTVENTQRGTENTSSRNGISADTQESAGERSDRVPTGEEGRSARLDDNSESRGTDERTVDSRNNNGIENVRGSDDRTAVSPESVRRTVRPDDSERTVNDGRTDRDLRQNVDAEYGEELSRKSGTDDVLSQISDGSTVGGQESIGVLGAAERPVRQESSTSDGQLRSGAGLVEEQEVRDRPHSNDGDSSRSSDNSLNLATSSNDIYAEYLSTLKDTRFTSLTEAQRFDFEHHSYVATPENSIWYEVEHSYRINNGIFEVSTPTHGGIMIKSDIARLILSKEAQNIAQKERGWYYFEEDCDYAVAKRELLDKNLFSDIDDYFSRQYNKKTAEYLHTFSNNLNESLQHWNKNEYWDKRETALFNALSPEEQAAEIGQLSLESAVATSSNGENDNYFEIYQLKYGEELRYHRSVSYDTLHKEGNAVEAKNYDQVYRAELNSGTTLEDIFTRFNINQPADFTGHSLMVSDIIVVHDNGETAAYYVDDVGFKRVPKFLQIEREPEIVQDFRNKTAEKFKPIDSYSSADIENIVKDYVESVLSDNEIEAMVGRVVVSGSRSRGLEKPDSDIDVVVEIDSELHEDALFNILHETEREIGGFKVDINPIRKEETGTLEAYLPNVEKYLAEQAENAAAPNYEQAIRDGFSALYANHKYSDKQRLFLDRIQKFAIKNNIAENIIDTAMAKNPAFHNTYGNREYVSRNIFGRRLGSTEKELEAAIKQAFERTPEKEPETLEDVVAKFFSSDSSEVKSVNGVWSMNLTDGEPYAEVYHNGEAACAIYLNDGNFTVRPYEELTSIPAMVTRALQAANPDNSVELLEFERTFETPLDKAKFLINDYCEGEFDEEAVFDNMHNIGLAHTTLTDYDIPVQVTADLIDHKITYEFANEVYNVEQYKDIEDMIENGLVGLDFDELVDVPDEVIERHVQEIENDNSERYVPTYMRLSRYQADCKYVINNADETEDFEGLKKYLYGGSVDTCINEMRELYNKLPDDAKPEWLSKEDIDRYEQQLNALSGQIERPSVQHSSQILVSAEINGEINYYNLSGNSIDDIMKVAKTIDPFVRYADLGSRISGEEYAAIQQSADFSFSVELDFDNDAATIYRVNGGQGGVSEGDRTDDNVSFENVKISAYRLPYTGLGAEEIPVSAEYAISMWDNGFTVYLDDKAVPKRSELPAGTDVVELFSNDKVFAAAFGDVKQQQMIDFISNEISDLDATMSEERYIDIREFVDYDEDNVFEWDNSQNVYLNITKALIERNWRFIDDYLTSVKNEFDSMRGSQAQEALVEYANYTPPSKECDTIIDIPEYGLKIDLKDIDELILNDTYSEYEGGIDSNGHERKDNYSEHYRSLEIHLDPYGTADVITSDDIDVWSPSREDVWDLRADSSEMSDLRKKIANFIKSSEQLSITTFKEGNSKLIELQEAAVATNSNEVTADVATSSNEIEQLTDELNAQTLSDVEVGDILLLHEPENGEAMYFRIDSMQNDFMVSMTRVADAAGNDYTEIGLATKGIIDGHWKETLLDENTDFPIVRYTKNYQEELKENAILQIPKYGITVNLKDILSFCVEDTNYRKNSESLNRMLSVSLNSDGTATAIITTENSDKKPVMDFDLSDEADKKALIDLISDTISHAGELNVYSLSKDNDVNVAETFDIFINESTVATNSNELTANVDTSSNEPVSEYVKKPHRATRAEKLYREFTEAFPDIADGTHTHERYGAEYDEYGENDAFEPLSIEYLGEDTYAFMTWYVQNGDLMRDPDFVFTLDHEKKELHVWEYQMDGVPAVGTVYQSVTLEDGTFDKKLQAALEENFRLNLRNAVSAGRELSSYTDINGEVHELQEQTERISEPEQSEIEDESAVYRETLNAFSEKHNLGELNIVPDSNGFRLTEKYQDGESAAIWHISKPYAEKPLTVEELETELTAFEKSAERNHTSIGDYGYRKSNAQRHGGASELPPVQDNLPEIKYADNPYAKVRDNLAAIKEAKRIEECELNGEYPFSSGRNDYNSIEASMGRLRRYSGWGGLSQVFDERFTTMENLRKQLKETLTEEEYAAARSSTLTSHYTPQVIIDEMYKTIRNMGVSKDSRILEPSCGTGNFISRMPHDMGNGGIVGVELDPITALIAKHLNVPKENPDAKEGEKALEDNRDVKILNCGFEKSNLENNSFDVVIGNVPFGDFKLNDPDYVNDWLIHDAFIRKALDKVAAGGIVAVITSSGTLDKKNPKIREQLAMKADLIGAVRLPNNAFADAGTPVTSDVIFLQKRKTPLNVYDPKPDWCYTSPVEVGVVGKKHEGETRTASINSYFAQNPQMVLGTMKQTTHFDMLTCEPDNSRTLSEQLETAFRQLNAKISIENRERSNLEKKGYIEPWGKTFTYQIKDDKIYYNLGNAMEEFNGNDNAKAQLKGLIELRDITRELLNKQQSYVRDEELVPLRNKLNEAYDNFIKEYGSLTNKKNKKLFSQDADYPILDALENIDSETKEITKAAIFTRRTVNPVLEVTEVATTEEAMQVSLDKRGKVDIPYMATLLQNQYESTELNEIMEIITEELLEKGLIFRDPEKIATGKPYIEIVDKAEYLCGDVRRKLAMAEAAANQDEKYSKNVEALREVIPEDIGAAEISVDIGCTWIDTDDYEEFMRELSGRTEYDSRLYSLRFSEITGKFTIENARARNTFNFNPNELSTYGTEDMNMYHIMQNLLNQQKIQVFDYIPDPKDPKKVKSVLNKNKTQVAQSKAKVIQQKFREWIFASDKRKEKYVRRYNDKFNNLVGRSYDGSHLTFEGIESNFHLRKHQLDCVARTIYGGNTLVAHCVGAGKSAVMAASVMKKKELGLINKACVVVPKPLTEQTEREWRSRFPDAKLLVVDNKNLSDEKKRELFTARVATGDYDAIIMSQEQFEKLPMSEQHQLDFLYKQIAEMQDQLAQNKRESGRRDPSVKELEAAIKRTQNRIDNILNPKSKSRGKDSLLNFESLGFDYLVVDEAHAYKNGFVMTKMGDVSGVNTRESGRAGDMQMKCDYLNSEFGNGHILFATGTPVATLHQFKETA